jgi:hypothetical protein
MQLDPPFIAALAGAKSPPSRSGIMCVTTGGAADIDLRQGPASRLDRSADHWEAVFMPRLHHLLPAPGELLYQRTGDQIKTHNYRAVAAALLVHELFQEFGGDDAALAGAMLRVSQLLDDDREELHVIHVCASSQDAAAGLIEEMNAQGFLTVVSRKTPKSDYQTWCGDLGYRYVEDLAYAMGSGFAAVACQLEVGKFSGEPVQTWLGWHVIKLEDRRRKWKRMTDLVKKWRDRKFWREEITYHEGQHADPRDRDHLSWQEFQVITRRRLSNNPYARIARTVILGPGQHTAEALAVAIATIKRLQATAELKIFGPQGPRRRRTD